MNWSPRSRLTLQLDGEPVMLDTEDLQVRLQAKPGWAAAQGKSAVVVLSTELTDELVSEGLSRELVHAIQIATQGFGTEIHGPN